MGQALGNETERDGNKTMTLDVVNVQNEKVGSLDVSEEVFGRVNTSLIWESVVHQNAAERRGTHSTKTRGEVRGSGKKPWRQKGTGRARVGQVRTPLWRSGGITFGPRPRSYDYRLPRKMERGGLRSAIAQKVKEGAVTLLDQLTLEEAKTKVMAELLARFETSGRTLVVDVKPEESVVRATGNLANVRLVPSGRLTARDVIGARRLLVTQAAFERLQQVLGGGVPEVPAAGE